MAAIASEQFPAKGRKIVGVKKYRAGMNCDPATTDYALSPMNRPPKSSARNTKPANSHTPAKAVEQASNVKSRKIDNSRLASRARGNGSARGK